MPNIYSSIFIKILCKVCGVRKNAILCCRNFFSKIKPFLYTSVTEKLTLDYLTVGEGASSERSGMGIVSRTMSFLDGSL